MKWNKKPLELNKKAMIISIVTTMLLLLFVIPNPVSAGLTEILCDAIGGLFIFIGDGIKAILGKDWLDGSLDKIVYNVDEFSSKGNILSNYNLTLLSTSSSLSEKLFTIYYAFVYMACSMLGVIFLWTTFDFIKTASDIQHQAVLKTRLKKLFLMIILLLSLPVLLDTILAINQALLDVFRLLALDVAKVDTSGFSDGFMLSTFKDLADKAQNSEKIVLSIVYIGAGVINVWLVIFYMLRDFSIAILFIIAPVIIILLPYRTDIVLRWLKEFISNILTQTIHGFLLSIVLIIASGISEGNPKFTESIFVLISLAMMIPTCTAIKRIIGLEGEMGAAKSNTGIGALKAAAGIGVTALAIGKGTFSRVSQGIGNLQSLKGEEMLMNKSSSNVSETGRIGGLNNDSSVNSGSGSATSSNGGLGQVGLSSNENRNPLSRSRGIEVDPNNRVATSRNHGVEVNGNYGDSVYSATSRGRQIQGMKRQIKKDIAKSILGGAGAILGTVAGAGAGAALGDAKIAGQVASASGGILGDIGTSVGDIGSNAVSYASEKIKDIRYGDGIRYDGEQNAKLNNIFDGTKLPNSLSDVKRNINTVKSNYNKNKAIIQGNKANLQQTQIESLGIDTSNLSPEQVSAEIKARVTRDRYERRGLYNQAHTSYARHTYDRNNKNEVIQNSDDLTSTPKLESAKIEGRHFTDDLKVDALNKSLQQHMEDYKNNYEYLQALDECTASNPPMFTSSDESQLS